MRIGIISDTHDDVEYTNRAIDIFEKKNVEVVIHAGDVIPPAMILEFKRLTEKIDFKNTGKKYWLYDLFEWKEGDEHTHMPGHDEPRMYEKVVERFADQPWINIIAGPVPNSFVEGFPKTIAFAHIDMNHPFPEEAALKKVLPKLSPGGCIIFDDYGWWGYSAQKRVLDPIAANMNLKILELPTGQGLLIKTGSESEPIKGDSSCSSTNT